MKKFVILTFIITSVLSCNDFEGWNLDEKNPSEVPASFLFTSAQKNLFLRMTSASVNYNIFKQFSQHWTATTYFEEANYDLRTRDVSGTFFTYMYRDVLVDLEESKRVVALDETLTDSEIEVHQAMADLLQVFTFHVLVDTYGDIPYSEALKGLEVFNPVYDNDADIYADLFNRIDNNIVSLGKEGNAYGNADMIYGGNTDKWIKFANSLKLRMALRIADFDSSMAQTKASDAFNSGVFESSNDNANYAFGSVPNANPIWVGLVQSGRNDIVVANTFTDIIGPLNDPRSPYYMDDNLKDSNGNPIYEGGPYGENNTYSSYTHAGDPFHREDLEGIILSYEEVLFMLAEAVERGFISGDAESYYNMAISASIEYWTGSTDKVDSYLSQSSVAYSSAQGNWKEKIGTQKWIALYTKGFAAWSSWRMLDYPLMNQAANTTLPVPRRYLYGNDDAQLNGANYDAASEAMGGDNLDSRVFWDKTGTGN